MQHRKAIPRTEVWPRWATSWFVELEEAIETRDPHREAVALAKLRDLGFDVQILPAAGRQPKRRTGAPGY